MQAPKRTTPTRETLRAKAALNIEQQPAVVLEKQAIEEGQRPLPARRKDADQIKGKALDLYGIPPGGLATIPLIEAGFQFSPLDSDADFCYLHVESLLERAAGLLDRCAVVRSERDRLHIERWKLQLDLDQFIRLGEIRERERQAGADTLTYERAAIDSGAERAIGENHKNADSQLKGLLDDLLSSGFNRRMAARELSKWLSAYPLKDRELSGDDAAYVFDGAKRSKPEHLFEAARMEVDEAAWEQVYSLMAARFAETAAAESGRLRKESLDLQAKWSLADIRFRGDRAQVERDAGWERIYQAQSPHGLLNYAERIAPLERRFADDFREALACLTAARRGLKELLGYDAPFPEKLPASDGAGYFDEVVQWNRKAMNRMWQFSQADQSYVLVVSVKELAQSQWEAGRTAAAWTFEIPETLFPAQAHVRLRGLGVAVVGPKPEPPPDLKAAKQKADLPKPEPVKLKGFWTARVSAPPDGRVKLLSGVSQELDQKMLPVRLLGRVSDRDTMDEPEIAAIPAWRNASPIGKEWKLMLSAKSTDGTPTEQLDDVQIYLHVTARGLKAGS